MSRDALIIGINSYDRLKSLKSPSEDAEAIAQLLEQYGEFRVKRFPAIKDKETGQSKVGQTTKVSLTQLEEALIQLFNPKGESISETALLFFSGHGLRKDRGITEGFLASSDVNTSVGHWGLSLQWLRRLLQASLVRQQIIWLDCCYSGELLNFEEANSRSHARRGNADFDAPASANYTAPPDRCHTHSHAGAWEREESRYY